MMQRLVWLIALLLLLPTGAPLAAVQSVDGVTYPASVDGVTNPTSVDGVAFFWSPNRTWSYNPATGVWTNLIVPGSELINNTGFETGNPPTGWSPIWDAAHSVLSQVTDNRPGSSGTKAMSAIRGAGNTYPGSEQTYAGTAFDWYLASGWYKDISSANSGFSARNSTGSNAFIEIMTANPAWTNLSGTGRSPTASVKFRGLMGNCPADGNELRGDDVSLKVLPASSLFLTRSFGWNQGRIAIPFKNVTENIYIQKGGIACLDSQTNPQNYFLFYRYGANAIALDKIIAGVPTSIIATAVAGTYHQNYYLVFKRTATKVQIFYNAAGDDQSGQIDSDYTLVDGDPAGTIHGYFSTDVSVLLGEALFVGPLSSMPKWGIADNYYVLEVANG